MIEFRVREKTQRGGSMRQRWEAVIRLDVSNERERGLVVVEGHDALSKVVIGRLCGAHGHQGAPVWNTATPEHLAIALLDARFSDIDVDLVRGGDILGPELQAEYSWPGDGAPDDRSQG